MNYLTLNQIILIHAELILTTGGSHGLRSPEVLFGVELAPQQAVFGKDLYPTVFVKAAVYARDIIALHPFVDGNKRTGIVAAMTFLENNGYRFSAKRGEVENFAVKIAVDKPEIYIIAVWLKKHSRRRP